MTRIGRRLIEDFLLPALDSEKYGELLKWEDKEVGSFSIRWSHKNAAKWTNKDTSVFQDWDKLKGRYKPESKGYHMQAKQRFRAALYKLNTVTRLASPDKYTKCYQLCLDEHKNAKKRKENRTSIPTSVIQYGRGGEPLIKKNSEDFKVSPSKSPISIKKEDQSEDKVTFSEKDYDEYQYAIKRQRKQSSPHHYPQQAVKTDPTSSSQISVLRESPQQNICRKNHLQHQVVPDYKMARVGAECTLKQPEEHPQAEQNNIKNQIIYPFQTKHVESPKLFCVQTFQNVGHIDPNMERSVTDFLKESYNKYKQSAGALNLSVSKNGLAVR